MIDDNLSSFAGKPVVDWDPETGIQDPEGSLPRVAISWDDNEEGITWNDQFARFLADPAVERVTGLVVGSWGGFEGEDEDESGINGVIEALVAARTRLPNLTALFLGDITYEENEISWIRQGDVSPLFEAFPQLEHLGIRGAAGLRLGRPHHARLKTLILQSGGLGAEVVAQVAAAQLPELEHLELWLGEENYGGDSTLEDLQPFLSGNLFPKLKNLGLCDSPNQDEIAAAVVSAPVMEQLEVLNLSDGTLGDVGAAALLASPAVKRLKKLDLHHHYCSEGVVAQLQALGIEVDVSDPQSEDQYGRFIAHSE